MLNNEQITQLKQNGYIRVENMLDKGEINFMMNIMHDFREDFYTEELLKRRVAYLSDSSETRISNAFMVTTGETDLPAIRVDDYTGLASILNDYQTLLQALAGDRRSRGAVDTRCMLNMQQYFAGSKPIPWHFDGEYLDLNDTYNTDDAIVINEMITAKWVAVYTLENDNFTGATLKDIVTGEQIEMSSAAGDFIMFDNTKFLHSVRELKQPRAMFGFRNFDYEPYLYTNTYTSDAVPTKNECFTGYVKQISTQEAEMRMEVFIANWSHNYTADLQAKF